MKVSHNPQILTHLVQEIRKCDELLKNSCKGWNRGFKWREAIFNIILNGWDSKTQDIDYYQAEGL